MLSVSMSVGGSLLAPGELPVEAQFTEFQQGARVFGASLVTNNRPRWYANIETEYMGS